MATTTRQAAWRTGGAANGWHDDLVWYAAAIHQMRLLSPGYDDFLALYDQNPGATSQLANIARQWSDPRSLGYQSQVHGTFVRAVNWPSHAGKKALWQECAHNHWFFLPWHRAYLLEFEAIVRSHVEDLGGPSDWALPYWNYSDHAADAQRLELPQPLQGATLPAGVTVPGVDAAPDGTFPNPLFNPTRQGPVAGDDPGWATATTALLRPHFANQEDTGAVSLGGGVLEDPNNAALFHRANEIGMLDIQPHGSTHGEVGGTMNQFETAALDPVFWMHHANIDRLWETYANDLKHGYPFTGNAGAGTAARASWESHQFRFNRPDGTTSTWTAKDVIDIDVLGYAYDTTAAPPLPANAPPAPQGSGVDPFGLDAAAGPEPIAEGATAALGADQEVVLSGGDGSDADTGVEAFPGRTRWVLRFDGIRAAAPAPTSYHVFLGLESGATADPSDAEHYAGLLSLFGVFESSRDDGTSSAAGQRRTLDVTDVVNAQASTLRPLSAPVRLVATNPDRDLGAAQMSIERIALEFA